jgi:hypothetical protein
MKATSLLLVFQRTTLLVAFAGRTVASRGSLSPTPKLAVFWLRAISVTLITFEVTTTLHVAVFPPSSEVAVMMAFPGETAVTVPLLTVATEALLEVHRTVLLSAFEGETVAVRVYDSPSIIVIDEESNVMLVTETADGPCTQALSNKKTRPREKVENAFIQTNDN